MTADDTPLTGRYQPLKGQMELPGIIVECPRCWVTGGAHMHFCPLAKLTERQRMMS